MSRYLISNSIVIYSECFPKLNSIFSCFILYPLSLIHFSSFWSPDHSCLSCLPLHWYFLGALKNVIWIISSPSCHWYTCCFSNAKKPWAACRLPSGFTLSMQFEGLKPTFVFTGWEAERNRRRMTKREHCVLLHGADAPVWGGQGSCISPHC